MKKVFLFQLLIAVFLVPLSHATQNYCIHLTNFCDTLWLQESNDHAYGGWDWECDRDWTSAVLLGNMTGKRALAGRPSADGGNILVPYSAEFYFRSGNVFDLFGTGGIQTGIIQFQFGQPYTITNGACRLADVDRRKPQLVSSIEPQRPARAQEPSEVRCLHFKNYCDSITFSAAKEPPWTLLYGNWDWMCRGDAVDQNMIGNAKDKPQLTTRPGIDYVYVSPYTSEFSFKAGSLFDLYETAGVGQGVFTTRTNEPFSVTNGACTQNEIDHHKPRLLDR